jgi:Ca2+-binding RTX toxin-like protein
MLPQIERMESRRLFVATAPFGVTGTGTLIVQGTAGDDAIVVTSDGAKVTVTINGLTGSFQDVARIRLEGAAGADSIRFAGTLNVPVTLLGGRGDDDLVGAGRHVTLSGGAGNDTLTAQGQRGVTMIGGLGDDVLRGAAGVDSFYGGAGNDDGAVVGPGEFYDSIEVLRAITPQSGG